MAEEKAGMSTGKKVLIIFIIIFLALTAAAYYAGLRYFTGHFLPGSMVNGFNCSYMTEKETEELLSQKVGAFVLAVETQNHGVESISAGDVGLDYVPDGKVGELMLAQNRYKWFLAFSQHETYQMEVLTGYDAAKMEEAVGALDCMQLENVIMPSDAFIKDNGESFEIVPEVEGSYLNKERTVAVIADAMVRGITSVNLEEAGCYERPVVHADDPQLVKNCEQMNEIVKVVITYDFADRRERVDRTLIKDWLTVDVDGNVTLDENKVAEYVYELGRKYDTFGCTRTFRTYNGREITIEGGDYGWAIDQTGETYGLIEAILSGETQVREPVYAYEAWSRDSNDIGYTYVEIDLTAQRLVLYVNGYPQVDTPIVSGNPNYAGSETPTGCFAIDNMSSPAVLTGEGYEQHVDYWIPFTGNVGIHDASWRTQFGGNLYLIEGSHGCVNVPHDQAAAIYSQIGIGAPVIVYK